MPVLLLFLNPRRANVLVANAYLSSECATNSGKSSLSMGMSDMLKFVGIPQDLVQ